MFCSLGRLVAWDVFYLGLFVFGTFCGLVHFVASDVLYGMFFNWDVSSFGRNFMSPDILWLGHFEGLGCFIVFSCDFLYMFLPTSPPKSLHTLPPKPTVIVPTYALTRAFQPTHRHIYPPAYLQSSLPIYPPP